MDPFKRYILFCVFTCITGNTINVIFHSADLANNSSKICEPWMLFVSGMNLAWCVVMTMMILYSNWSLWRHMHECKLVHMYTSGFDQVNESTPVMRSRAIGLGQAYAAHRPAYRPGRLQGQPQELDIAEVLSRPQLPLPKPPSTPPPPTPPPRPRTPPPPQPQRYEYIDLHSLPKQKCK